LVSTGVKRSSFQKGEELESQVRDFLVQKGFRPISKKKVHGKCGVWELDIFLDTKPPVVIECKNPTPEARTPSDSIRRKAQEAFLTLYDLKKYSNLRNAIFVLVTGELPLRPNPIASGVRDYENFLRETLGESFYIFNKLEMDRLLEIIPH
jgi:Holliday junction resolvase-like predicted endonuclease